MTAPERAGGQLARKALVLVTDAYGGRGGIALYNRNLLQALCAYPGMEKVVAVPRKIYYALEAMPGNLDYRVGAAGTIGNYLWACLKLLLAERNFDLIVCGHLHLLPFARFLGFFYGCQVVPVIYGVEAWTPTSHASVNYFCRGVKKFASIRRLTARRFMEWAKIPGDDYFYLPNCIDGARYGVAPRSQELVSRYKLEGKTVIMTSGRLDSGKDLNKGFDEILEVLPELRLKIPGLMYLIMGDGEDRPRLEQKARALGVSDIVVFTGYVGEAEKAAHYRLADVFAMPGSHSCFDTYPYRFVFLEALACGVPVVGAKLEDPWEVNDPDSALIIQADPHDRQDIIRAILTALSLPKGEISPILNNYYCSGFVNAVSKMLDTILVTPNA